MLRVKDFLGLGRFRVCLLFCFFASLPFGIFRLRIKDFNALYSVKFLFIYVGDVEFCCFYVFVLEIGYRLQRDFCLFSSCRCLLVEFCQALVFHFDQYLL